ncbi:MAG TPA: Rrf2 family transcriptional regulator [Coriobacteriia bacterium]|nr:Rrf2 family transcriptional regulator [Coriobacteriia bacterium]
MSITRRTDYAVRLMYELAQLPQGATLSARDLCELAEVPESFGGSLVPFLKDAGLVRAEGYRDHLLSLALPAHEITMADIVGACEPEFSLSQCTRDPQSCGRSDHCGVHDMWEALDRVVWTRLKATTLAEVVLGAASSAAGHSSVSTPRESPAGPTVMFSSSVSSLMYENL